MINAKVHSFLKKKQIDLTNKVIVVGVSGGPDSMALLNFLYEEQKRASFQLVAACLDHMFRKEQSYEEALFVFDFCKERDIPCEIRHIDVTKYMEEHALSTQVAARECRYQFFTEVMEKYQADYLALAHHGDDQIESVMMRLTRGATANARAGIMFQREFSTGFIIRPFLPLTKEEIYEYLNKESIEYRLDPSNEKDDYFRNRIRHHVLPHLKKENPLVHQQFQRFSDEILEDEALLALMTKEHLEKIISFDQEKEIQFSIKQFRQLPIPLQRRGIHLILNYLYKNYAVSLTFTHVDQIFTLLTSEHPSIEINLPQGLKVLRAYDNCQFSFVEQLTEDYEIEITSEGEYILPTKEVIQVDYEEVKIDKISEWELFLPLNDETFPITIRTIKAGDRIRLPHLNGTKKVNRLFIDEKIPLTLRKNWPMLVSKTGEILWVIGLRKAAYEHTTHTDKGYIKIVYNKLNSSRGTRKYHEK